MNLPKRNGFTLIEVLVGLVILVVGLLAIAGMLLTSVKGNYFSNHLTQASYIAQDRLEYLKTLPITHASLTPGTHTSQPEAGSVTSSGQVFSRSYTVVVNGHLRTITYTVTWNDGRDHTVSFTTMRSI